MAINYTQVSVLNQVLPAAGAVVTSSPIAINSYTNFTPLLSYTRGAAGGSVRVVIEVATEYDPLVYFQIGETQFAAIAAGTDVQALLQRGSILYTSTAAGAETVTLPTFNVNASYVRFKLREVGAVGTPGNIRLLLDLRNDKL